MTKKEKSKYLLVGVALAREKYNSTARKWAEAQTNHRRYQKRSAAQKQTFLVVAAAGYC